MTNAVPAPDQRVLRHDQGPRTPVVLDVGPADDPVRRVPRNAQDGGSDGGVPQRSAPGEGRTLLRLVHLTDFQHGDLASPLRNDFLQKYRGIPYWARMLPAYRPQEFLQWHALASVVRTVNGLSQDPALAPDLVVTTGDATDSAQGNELREYLTLMDGGRVRPGAHNRDLRDAPSFGKDESFWLPESSARDAWKSNYGLPYCPGLRERAAATFEHRGLNVPWLACFGNHDRLVQGRVDPEHPAWASVLDAALGGDRKPSGERVEVPPEDRARPDDDAYATYLEDPTVFLPGSWQEVVADPARAVVDRAAYIRAHRESAPEDAAGVVAEAGAEAADEGAEQRPGGEEPAGVGERAGDADAVVPAGPAGHGFTAENARTGLGYYVHDVGEDLRFIVLDTNNPRGDVDGCLDQEQFHWLEERLAEVHSEHRDEAGNPVRHPARDRAVVLMSHHGTAKLTNDFGFRGTDERVHLREDVLALLVRFDNVVLWLNGHTHVNVVESRNDAPEDPPSAAFWEITISAVAEWPVQVRHLDLGIGPDGAVRIRTRMIDSRVPVMPEEAGGASAPADGAGGVEGIGTQGAVTEDAPREDARDGAAASEGAASKTSQSESAGTETSDDVARLASLHRWVAAHDDGSVGGLHADGEAKDRTTDLTAPVSAALVARWSRQS